MTTITDEYMYEMLPRSREYSIVLLKPGPKTDQPDLQQIIWEHGRRNFALRAEGVLSIVCPVTEETGLSGLCIFNAGPEESNKYMEEDPAVQAGIFVFEIHPCRGFPGDNLPEK
ncbi:MAG TPA: hypothetical protein VFX58_09550 [Chitinophagaceae bacterium]|nr:hypothetical protein [Chitinophagaceae bacterium]